MSELAALVILLRTRPGRRTWLELADEVMVRGSALAALDALAERDLLSADVPASVDAACAEVRGWLDAGLQMWSIADAQYPPRVRDIPEAPPFLFARGRHVLGEPAVSVVGSRAASGAGLRRAADVSAALVERGICVIAGLAAGIDTAAHRAALEHGGRTIAVIGTGINQYYPATNRALQERIAVEGLLLSQFWPDAPPQRHNFPMRNAVMSGYGVATVVIEAGEHSGARIQARLAVQHGRPVILTDLVVERTQWGRDLAGRQDVYVAQSLGDVIAVVDMLAQRPDVVREAIDQIAV